ncbi:MAG: hypothetical protein Q9177_005218 [Variospora cf. flavescens]
MLGSSVSAAATRRSGNTRRLSLCLNFFLQGLSILVAAILINTDVIPENTPNSSRVLIGIPFLAWQFGAQVASSRALGYNEIPTTVLTSVYNDLASDSKLWTWKNVKRNRRAGAALMLLLGGICGGWLSKLKNGFGIVLWVGGLIKVFVFGHILDISSQFKSWWHACSCICLNQVQNSGGPSGWKLPQTG